MATEILPEGARIEVQSRFDGHWARGFVIEKRVDDGYVVRRVSDDSVLPAVFTADEIRLERRRQGLWWA